MRIIIWLIFCRSTPTNNCHVSSYRGEIIQVRTIVGNILAGLESGRSVPLKRIAVIFTPSTSPAWDKLVILQTEIGMDVISDTNTLKLTERCLKNWFFVSYNGNTFVTKEFNEQTEEWKTISALILKKKLKSANLLWIVLMWIFNMKFCCLYQTMKLL